MAIAHSALRVLKALAKAQLKKALRDETLEALASVLTDLGYDELLKRLDSEIDSEKREKALAQALERADECARKRLREKGLVDLADLAKDLPLRDLPSILSALKDLPEDNLEEEQLRAALKEVFERDWRLSQSQAKAVADIYLVCLREALLEVETEALREIGRSVLRTEEAVKRLDQAIREWREKEEAAIRKAFEDLDRKLETIQAGIEEVKHGQEELKRGQQAILHGQKVILERISASASRSHRVPIQVPPLPQYFVSRDEVAEPILEDLFAEDSQSPGILVVSAIHGLGSIGKSTLAAYLAHREDVQKRFPDGILWATLGQDPDVLKLLAGWIRAAERRGCLRLLT